MFKFVMITLLITADGPPQKIKESFYTTMEDCRIHQRQKEITTFSDHKGFYVHLCGHKLVEGKTISSWN